MTQRNDGLIKILYMLSSGVIHGISQQLYRIEKRGEAIHCCRILISLWMDLSESNGEIRGVSLVKKSAVFGSGSNGDIKGVSSVKNPQIKKICSR